MNLSHYIKSLIFFLIFLLLLCILVMTLRMRLIFCVSALVSTAYISINLTLILHIQYLLTVLWSCRCLSDVDWWCSKVREAIRNLCSMRGSLYLLGAFHTVKDSAFLFALCRAHKNALSIYYLHIKLLPFCWNMNNNLCKLQQRLWLFRRHRWWFLCSSCRLR